MVHAEICFCPLGIELILLGIRWRIRSRARGLNETFVFGGGRGGNKTQHLWSQLAYMYSHQNKTKLNIQFKDHILNINIAGTECCVCAATWFTTTGWYSLHSRNENGLKTMIADTKERRRKKENNDLGRLYIHNNRSFFFHALACFFPQIYHFRPDKWKKAQTSGVTFSIKKRKKKKGRGGVWICDLKQQDKC